MSEVICIVCRCNDTLSSVLAGHPECFEKYRTMPSSFTRFNETGYEFSDIIHEDTTRDMFDWCMKELKSDPKDGLLWQPTTMAMQRAIHEGNISLVNHLHLKYNVQLHSVYHDWVSEVLDSPKLKCFEQVVVLFDAIINTARTPVMWVFERKHMLLAMNRDDLPFRFDIIAYLSNIAGMSWSNDEYHYVTKCLEMGDLDLLRHIHSLGCNLLHNMIHLCSEYPTLSQSSRDEFVEWCRTIPECMIDEENRLREEWEKNKPTVSPFHKLLAILDKNSEAFPEGDYLEATNLLKEIFDKSNYNYKSPFRLASSRMEMYPFAPYRGRIRRLPESIVRAAEEG